MRLNRPNISCCKFLCQRVYECGVLVTAYLDKSGKSRTSQLKQSESEGKTMKTSEFTDKCSHLMTLERVVKTL